MDDALRPILRLLRPHQAQGVRKLRLGPAGDGGYVLLDDFAGIDTAIGCGVGGNVHFERDLGDRTINVHLYDHTVERLPGNHPRLSFHQKRVGAAPAPDGLTLQQIVATTNLAPQRSLLKMDIEGDEWKIFAGVDRHTLGHFRQIVCEFHYLDLVRDLGWRDIITEAVANVARDFMTVHVHGNNHAPVVSCDGKPVPTVLEVTFANRACYVGAPGDESFPTPLDRANHRGLPDIELGRFVF